MQVTGRELRVIAQFRTELGSVVAFGRSGEALERAVKDLQSRAVP
jgi:hypothetical protein